MELSQCIIWSHNLIQTSLQKLLFCLHMICRSVLQLTGVYQKNMWTIILYLFTSTKNGSILCLQLSVPFQKIIYIKLLRFFFLGMFITCIEYFFMFTSFPLKYDFCCYQICIFHCEWKVLFMYSCMCIHVLAQVVEITQIDYQRQDFHTSSNFITSLSFQSTLTMVIKKDSQNIFVNNESLPKNVTTYFNGLFLSNSGDTVLCFRSCCMQFHIINAREKKTEIQQV